MLVKLEGLQRVREARVLSQRMLAKRAGVSFQTVFRIEHGLTEARPSTAHKLAQALRVDLDELMSKEGTGVPLGPLYSLQHKATELLMILERDALRAEEEDS